jgi:hypothetical protein
MMISTLHGFPRVDPPLTPVSNTKEGISACGPRQRLNGWTNFIHMQEFMHQGSVPGKPEHSRAFQMSLNTKRLKREGKESGGESSGKYWEGAEQKSSLL